MRGRPPKPTEIKRVSGNPGKRKLNSTGPKPTSSAGIFDPPKTLTPSAKAIWRQKAPELVAQNVLTSWDLENLEMFARYTDEWRVLDKAIRKEGYTITTEGGNVKMNPLVVARNQAAALSAKFGAALGLNPLERDRMHVGQNSNEARVNEEIG